MNASADTVVLIPTANRPEFLRTALQSVASQLDLHRVLQVRVMENGGSRRSEAVCAEFGDRLPMVYVYRDPPLSIAAHGMAICEETYPGKFIALLHDDDWWAPDHLGGGLRALGLPGAVASQAAYFFVNGENAPLYWDYNLHYWIASKYRATTELWPLGMTEVLVANLGGAAGHYSSLVADAAVFRKCADHLRQNNAIDTDRNLSVALTRFGKLVYRPMPSVYVRVHPAQDQQVGSTHLQRMNQLGLTSLWMLSVAEVNRINLMAEWRRCVDACPSRFREGVANQYARPWLYKALRRHKGLPQLVRDLWMRLEKEEAEERAKAKAANQGGPAPKSETAAAPDQAVEV